MGSVVIRPPTRGELERAAYIGQVAFNSPDIEPWLKSYEWLADNRGLEFLVVAEADGEIVASLLCTPGQAHFMNDVAPLSAVGGVATLPEHRRFGYAGLMMEESVRMLRRNGYFTSALWPFAYYYYRKYGWEVGSQHITYHLPTEFAAGLGSPDGVRPALPSDFPAISELVERFARGKNAVTVRDDLWWSCISSTYRFRFDGSADIRTSNVPWVHESGGRIDGYAFFVYEGEGEDQNLRIKEMIADTREARRAILARFAMSGTKEISFPAPSDDSFLQELPNPRAIRTNLEGGFQFRVIDPPAALECRTLDPSISGRLGFTITDPVLPEWNFDIEIEEGHIKTATNSRAKRLTMDVQAFAQLYGGYVSPARAVELGKLRADSEADLELASEVLFRGTPFRSFLELG